MSTIHHRRWRHLRTQVIREEPTCRLQLEGCTTITTTADHIIPRSQRPELTLVRSNCRGACESCNLRRGNRDLDKMRADEARKTGPPPALGFFS